MGEVEGESYLFSLYTPYIYHIKYKRKRGELRIELKLVLRGALMLICCVWQGQCRTYFSAPAQPPPRVQRTKTIEKTPTKQ